MAVCAALVREKYSALRAIGQADNLQKKVAFPASNALQWFSTTYSKLILYICVRCVEKRVAVSKDDVLDHCPLIIYYLVCLRTLWLLVHQGPDKELIALFIRLANGLIWQAPQCSTRASTVDFIIILPSPPPPRRCVALPL